jgi:hypothetical protein
VGQIELARPRLGSMVCLAAARSASYARRSLSYGRFKIVHVGGKDTEIVLGDGRRA